MATLYVFTGAAAAAGALAQASSKPAVMLAKVQGGLFKAFDAAAPTTRMEAMSAPQ